MEPRFELLFDIWLQADRPHNVGSGPRGRRLIFPVSGGRFEGPRMKGEVLPGGADWLVLDGDAGELDVRLTLRTEDGSLIYMAYGGVMRPFSLITEHMGRGESPSRDQYYWYTAPRFETGSEAYAWLNRTLAVGVGSVGPGGSVHYSVYALT